MVDFKKLAAKKKKPGTALVSMKEMEAMYAKEAETAVAAEPLGSNPVLKTRGKKFRIGEELLKAPLEVIILGSSRVNAYYEGDFDPDEAASPVCTAVARTEDEAKMAPPDTVAKKQHDTCNGCPKNEWGSADKGRGKACKNQRRVAFIGTTDKAPEPQIVTVMIPPTGGKKFSAYIKNVAKTTKRPLHGVISTLDFDPEQDWPVTVADLAGMITDPGLAMRAKKASQDAQEMLYAIPQTGVQADKPKRAAAKKKTGKRKF